MRFSCIENTKTVAIMEIHFALYILQYSHQYTHFLLYFSMMKFHFVSDTDEAIFSAVQIQFQVLYYCFF